jgi:uncharacterized protein
MTLAQPILLTAPQARVLGALVEKEVTTPDYYPLSLNALINACNQRSNREPVTDLDEDSVRQALHRLEDLQLGGRARSADGRVTKYEHWLGEAFNFSRAEAALICVLLLRGPQTPGELRGRTERLHRFEELADVIAGLDKLMERDPPLAAILPRQPGTKEARYAHLLCGPVESIRQQPSFQPGAESLPTRHEPLPPEDLSGEDSGGDPRFLRLESAVRGLQQEVAALQKRFDDLFGDG